jgi:hypothetical protein
MLKQVEIFPDGRPDRGRTKKSPDVETPGLWYLDLISVLDYVVKI